MTAALDAMVAAMKAACLGQFEMFDCAGEVEGSSTKVYLDGTFDIEKVARAGLAAIREPAGAAAAAREIAIEPLDGHYEQALGQFTMNEVFAAMIDAILKD